MRISLLMLLALGACKEVPTQNAYCDNMMWLCNDPTKPVCNLAKNECVSTLADLAGIDMASDAGGGCMSSAVCASTTPICDGVCRACTGPADDAACASHADSKTKCGTSGSCVECRTGADCPAAKPACDSTYTCQPCSINADCPQSICISTGAMAGQCAAATDVAWVDNTLGGCASGNATTAATAVCQISNAIAVGRKYIRVNGSATAYNFVSISSGNVIIIGPGPKGVTPSAKISGDATDPAINISGATTSVTLEGIEVTGGSAAQDGISCSNGSVGPSLTLFRSYVHGVVGGAGINVSKCKVTLERNEIGPGNAGGGVSLSGAQYSIFNNFIVGNASTTSPGVAINNGCSELAGGKGFRANTVAKNSNLAGVAGVQCNATSTLQDSIIWGNSTGDTGGGATCTLTNVVSGSTNPDFVDSTNPSTYDFHLNGKTTANNACCIDKVSTSTVTNDYDGRSRPQGASFDIGAHEVP